MNLNAKGGISMNPKKNKKINNFEKFIETSDKSAESTNNNYSYSDSKTMKNRFKHLFLGSKSRLKNTFNDFVKNKKGTCWELAMSYDYYLLSKNKKNHHIVAVKTSSITCHTFNIYVEDDNKLHIIDLFQNVGDKTIASYDDFNRILHNMYDTDYDKWYVLSEVKNNFSEKFKRLGMKKWAKFCGKTEKDGGFMVIDENNEPKKFEVNDPKSVKWQFSPFKFPTFG